MPIEHEDKFVEVVATTWINQTTFPLYNSLFTIQLASWSHSLCFLPYIDNLYSAIWKNMMRIDLRVKKDHASNETDILCCKVLKVASSPNTAVKGVS